MSDNKLFAKCKAGELRQDLDQALKKPKSHSKVILVLKKLVANVILNNHEVVPLMPEVIALLKRDSLEIRKLAFTFIVHFSVLVPEDTKAVIPIVHSLAGDKSPATRCLAVRSVSLIAIPEVFDAAIPVVSEALRDEDPTVRKVAAYAVARLFEQNPERVQSARLIDELNDLLYDQNQVVSSSALAALSFVTECEPSLSLSIDKNHSLTLIGYLSKTNEWNLTYILNSITLYVPQTSEEALDLIEVIMPSLQHENSAVVLNAVKLIVYFSNYVSGPELVIPTLSRRIGSSLAVLLDRPSEIQFLVLRNVILLLLGKRNLFAIDVELFYCKFDDPVYIKDTKLEIIYLLANEKNVASVLRELEEYAMEVDVPMARKAVRAFGNLAVKLENAASACVQILCNLMSHGVPYIVQELVSVMKNILRKYPGQFEQVLDEVMVHYKLIDEPDAQIALIWIIGQYWHQIESPGAILRDISGSIEEDPIEVQCALLTTVVKCYLKSPETVEDLLLQTLKWATEEAGNPDVRDRGFFYWRLLTADTQPGSGGEHQLISKTVVLNEIPTILAENDNVDPAIILELELALGLLASIYLKPIKSVFRLANPKTLEPSPALQPRTPISLISPDRLLFKKNDDVKPIEYTPLTSRSEGGDGFFTNSNLLASRLTYIDHDLKPDETLPNFKESIARRLSRRASLMLK